MVERVGAEVGVDLDQAAASLLSWSNDKSDRPHRPAGMRTRSTSWFG